MKKLVLLACAILFVLTFKYTHQVHLPEGTRAVIRSLTLPFKVALLYTKEADQELILPVEGVGVKEITDSWHAPRSGGRLHEGQDIFAKRGTVVRSATNGYVMRVSENPVGGKAVTVLGAGGRSYYYAHFDANAPGLGIGDYVTPETVLGYVGTTGNAAGTPPHLHFGLYTSEGAIDPLPLLTERVKPIAPAR